ncbi:hypothetical protein LV457_14875 [Mycobacterium sp. MYCO198283]|uniref:hypothetical protein n=1 Tax=Mycobacterium sp. MYCO198283 TaxID=2883505 RepID=UPI001E56FFBA|nr:hypothetical protein [Mycobacterium sp. MYCO198283]MCG5433562.1 hypothetical protein [Mycobacterium sp. MYCO198283]
MTRHWSTWFLVAVLVLVAAACSSPDHAGSAVEPAGPTGATEIPGGSMERLPRPSAPVVPASQQEAADTVTRYLQRTIDALPPGTGLDGRRYGTNVQVTYCEDDPADENAPVLVQDLRDMTLPPDTDTPTIVARTGEIWQQWGWDVVERDGFPKPNRFGYAADGYSLQIVARADTRQAPSLTGVSPCFPGSLRDDWVQRPPLMTQSPRPAG